MLVVLKGGWGSHSRELLHTEHSGPCCYEEPVLILSTMPLTGQGNVSRCGKALIIFTVAFINIYYYGTWQPYLYTTFNQKVMQQKKGKMSPLPTK